MDQRRADGGVLLSGRPRADWKACLAAPDPGLPLLAPGRIDGFAGVASDRLDDWQLRPSQPDPLVACGVHLGVTYPRPMVDHDFACSRALEAFRRLG